MPNSIVLIIDDEEMIRTTISSALSAAGYEPVPAGSVCEAFEHIEKSIPALIISDVYMSDGNGFDVLSRVRKQPTTVTVPFLLMTGRFEPAIMRRGMEMGADDFIVKPFSPRQLVASVDARLNRPAAEPDAEEAGEARLSSVVDGLPLLIGTCDASGAAMTYLNRPGYRLLQLDSTVPVRALQLCDLLGASDDRERVSLALEQVRVGKPWTGNLILNDGDGGHRTLTVMLTPHFDPAGNVDYLSIVAHEACDHSTGAGGA